MCIYCNLDEPLESEPIRVKLCEKATSECVSKLLSVKELDFSGNQNIRTLDPNLTQLKIIKCSGSAIETIPETFVNLERLEACDCAELGAIPSIWNLKTLRAENCPKLLELPYLHRVESVEVNGCQNLKTIPTLAFLKYLDCGRTGIEGLPMLYDLTWLNCTDCPHIRELPILSHVKILLCGHCPKLEKLGSMDDLRDLTCCDNISLTSVPNFLRLRSADFCGCVNLKEIPVFSFLKSLYLEDCHMLQTIPSIPTLEWLKAVNCFKLQSIHNCPRLKDLTVKGSYMLSQIPPHIDPALIKGCPLLVGSHHYDPMTHEKVKRIQTWWRKACPYYIRLQRLVYSETFSEIYYAPGSHGAYILQRRWEKNNPKQQS